MEMGRTNEILKGTITAMRFKAQRERERESGWLSEDGQQNDWANMRHVQC